MKKSTTTAIEKLKKMSEENKLMDISDIERVFGKITYKDDEGIKALHSGMITQYQLAKVLKTNTERIIFLFNSCKRLELGSVGYIHRLVRFYDLNRAIEIVSNGLPKFVEIKGNVIRSTEKAQLLAIGEEQRWIPNFSLYESPTGNVFKIKIGFAEKNIERNLVM